MAKPNSQAHCYKLEQTATRLELHNHCEPGMGALYVEFISGKARHRNQFGGGKKQPLAKAIGLNTLGKHMPLHVADLTAGLGRDAFVLAYLGCRVSLLERNDTVRALLADGLIRAQQATLTETTAATLQAVWRMTLHATDAISWLAQAPDAQRPDISYIDIMFPERKKSAKVQKDMQFLQAITADESTDEHALLTSALRHSRHRVAVKRPFKAPPLAGLPPDFSINGKTIRYDVYLCKTTAETNHQQ